MRDTLNPRARDERATEDLIALALAAKDDDSRWDLVVTLHYRGGDEEFRLAANLCRSHDARKRELGADILGQLGWADRTFLAESVDLLLELLSDPDESVLYSAAMALGHREDPRAIPSLCMLAEHPDHDIRFSVAFALGTFDDPAAISEEIRLSTDMDRNTRNWATFALGSLIEADTAEIREALFARSGEEDDEIRGEALVGLARRGDTRAFGLVRQELAREFVGSLALDAAELLADPSLVPPLRELRSAWDPTDDDGFSDLLDNALAACESKTKPNL